PAPPDIHPLSLHDALAALEAADELGALGRRQPGEREGSVRGGNTQHYQPRAYQLRLEAEAHNLQASRVGGSGQRRKRRGGGRRRSEEPTSQLQSLTNLLCP